MHCGSWCRCDSGSNSKHSPNSLARLYFPSSNPAITFG
ncbi:Uncharacterised protein [Vibrio cholerae]|nr:Uncharacterised protein [Vibrio cholerae]